MLNQTDINTFKRNLLAEGISPSTADAFVALADLSHPSYPDGTQLSGSYVTDILIDGDAAIVGDTEINGDCIVYGSLANTGGYELTVRGSVICFNGFLFNPSSASISQKSVTILGDIIIGENVLTATPKITNTWFDSVNDQYVAEINTDLNQLTGILSNPSITFTGGSNAGQTVSVSINAAYNNADTSSGTPDGKHVIFTDPTGLTNPLAVGDQFTAYAINDCTFTANPGQLLNLNVSGSFIMLPSDVPGYSAQCNLNAKGNNGANGSNIVIAGCFIGQVDVSGGDATSTLAAGSGGSFTSASAYSNSAGGGITSNGGNSSISGKNAGSGGLISISNDCLVTISSKGGNTSLAAGSSGSGGTITIGGDCIGGSINASGGTCSGSAPTTTGNGGSVTIHGSYVGAPNTLCIVLDGGSIQSPLSLPANSTVTLGTGGTLNVDGDVTVGTVNSSQGGISAQGGAVANITSTNAVTLQPGHGGSITICGNLYTGAGIWVTGGGNSSSSVGSIAGAGGIVIVYGDVRGESIPTGSSSSLTDSSINVDGGSVAHSTSSSHVAGAGGTITLGSCVGVLLSSAGGTITGATGAAAGNGGNGGTITIKNSANCMLNLAGGDRLGAVTGTGTGGNGGTLSCKWNLELIYPDNWSSYNTAKGGANQGTTSGSAGGAGGSITVGNDFVLGTRINGTNYDSNKFVLDGGTSSGTGNGGNGGTLTAYGDIIGNKITALGGAGSGTGGNGGAGGTISGRKLEANIVDVSGGNGTQGGSGGIVYIAGGANIAQELNALDGTGTTPAGNAAVYMAGMCNIRSLAVTNRSGNVIKQNTQATYAAAVLKLNAIPNLAVLAKSVGTTASIATMIGDSVFSYDPTGDAWYRHQGTAI